jgi:hypothetical protein
MTYPNLAGIITKDDVYSKGNGNYAASYVAWARIANHLHTHASGWEFHLKPTRDGDHIWKAPDGTGYLIGYFTGPGDEATADFPFPVMDNRNNPVQYDKISARALTDAHRRALCACAAFSLSLGYELWAKEEVAEAGTVASNAAPVAGTASNAASVASSAETKTKSVEKAKPATPQESTKNISPGEMPISEDEYQVVIALLSEVHKNDADKITTLTKEFRKEFNLDSKSALSKEIRTQKQVEFINAFLSS